MEIISQTKNRQSLKTLEAMAQKAFPENRIKEITELKEGFFNVAYELDFIDREPVILKVAPKPDMPVMTYEINIMNSEIRSMKYIIENTSIPVARILFYDDQLEICESPYFFMDKLSGKSYVTCMDSLSEESKVDIDRKLGQYNRVINQLTGDKFGYYGQPDRQGTDWFLVFKSMVEDAYDDAERMNITMGVTREELLEKLISDREYFQEVCIPKLVHWDLWAGNVFVNNGEITGLIDFERCIYGDELMEVGFRTYGYNKNFFEGYGIEQLDEKQTRRALWYDIYLFLVCSLECDYRKYVDRGAYEWGTSMTKQWMEKLGN